MIKYLALIIILGGCNSNEFDPCKESKKWIKRFESGEIAFDAEFYKETKANVEKYCGN